MQRFMRPFLAATCLAIGLATPVHATSLPVPEPSVAGLYAAAVAALVIASRLRRRK